MDNSPPVCEVKRGRDARDEPSGFGDGNLAVAVHAFAERLAFDVRHDIVDYSAVLTRIM